MTDELNQLASARADTLRLVAAMTQPHLDFSPGPGHWSIGEVVDHLLLVEQMYRAEIAGLIELKRAGHRPYLKRSFADINVSPLRLPQVVLPWLAMPLTVMNCFVPAIVRELATEYGLLPSRNPDRATPRPRRPGDELRSGLLSSLAETRALLAANTDLDFREMISAHPLTGASDVPHILRFLARHERRHQSQIGRVKADRMFPAR